MTKIKILKCIHCGELKEIPQKLNHKTSVCCDCRKDRAREYQRVAAIKKGKRIGTTGRVPYPLRDGYKTTGNLFKVMATKTFKCKTKEEWRELMRERLDELFKNEELCRWIFSHKGDDDEKPNKNRITIKKDFPDTRNITWEEYEKGLGNDEVDS